MDTNVIPVPLDQIQLRGGNVRTDLNSDFSKEGIKELAESIEEHGLLQPIVLRGPEGKPPYDVVVGQRRFLAHQHLNAKIINAVFTEAIDDTEMTIMSLSENLLRQELSHKDISNAVTKLYVDFKKDERKVQSRLGLSIRKIRSYIKIEEQATDKIKKLLYDERKISPADAKRAIEASNGDAAKADAMIDEIVKLTKYQKDQLVTFSKKNDKATVEEIVEKAKKPRMEETIILNSDLKTNKAIQTACKKLSVDAEKLIKDVLDIWLIENEFK